MEVEHPIWATLFAILVVSDLIDVFKLITFPPSRAEKFAYTFLFPLSIPGLLWSIWGLNGK